MKLLSLSPHFTAWHFPLGTFDNFQLNYKDHLGNNRLSYTLDPETHQIKILEENHYYPFGLKHGNYNAIRKDVEYQELAASKKAVKQVVPEAVKFKYYYQEQERQNELGLNWDSFKYRNYDYAIGRFMSVDPLAEKYAYNGVYNFSENRVLDARELEGLEAVLAITLGNEVNYRGQILKKANSKVISINLQSFGIYGFEDALITGSSSDPKGIGFIAIWGHGIPGKIWGDSNGNTEIRTSDLRVLKEAIINGNIKFAKNAIIYLGNCNAGTNGIKSFAAELSRITGVTVIGANGSVGLGKTGTQIENVSSMIYWVYYPKLNSFLSFDKGVFDKALGPKIDVVNLMNFAIRKTNPISPVFDEKTIKPIPIPIKPRGIFGLVKNGKFIDTNDYNTD